MTDFPRRASRPSFSYREFIPPRPLADFMVAGAVPNGDEVNGLLFPARILEGVNDSPSPYIVVGEIDYSDGRHFLDFAIAETWVKSRRAPCDVCGGQGEHVAVEVPRRSGAGVIRTRCPNDPRRGGRR